VDIVLGKPLDLEDLIATPDDGNRYEILDDALVMTPAPNWGHQHAVATLVALLYQPARDRGLEALPAPTAWRIGPGQVPEPDVVVARSQPLTARAIDGAPALVIEVLSPSGRGRDLFEKRRIFAAGGARWYWIVDPDEPSLTVLTLTGDTYAETARVVGDETYGSEEPVAIRVTPSDLVR
jgi:Uma2 family endonuclease